MKNNKMALASGIGLIVIVISYVSVSNDVLPKQKKLSTTVVVETPLHAVNQQIFNSSKGVLNKPDEQIMAQTPQHFSGKVFAPSLEGTEIDGRLKSDAQGNLILDLEVRDLFDYFLNSVADVSPEVAIGQLEKLARDNLPETTVIQVMALLDDYIRYKESAVELMKQDLIPSAEQTAKYQLEMLENSFQQLKDIRRQTMSVEAVHAFFYLEEAYGAYTLESIRIQNNDTFTAAEKSMYLALQRQNLPEIIKDTESRMLADTKTSREINELLDSNQSDTDVERILIDKGLPSDAVISAINYRKSQRKFEEMYSLYQNERKALLKSGLSVLDQEKEIDSLRQKYFVEEQFLTQAKVKDLRS